MTRASSLPDSLEKLTEAAKKGRRRPCRNRPQPDRRRLDDRPAEPAVQVAPHDIKYAGESSSSKRARLGKALADQKIDACVITSPASIAPGCSTSAAGRLRARRCPLGRAFLFLDGQAELFLNPRQDRRRPRRASRQ